MSGKNSGFVEIHIEGKAMLIAASVVALVCDNVIALTDGESRVEADESYEEIKKQLV